MIKTLLLATTLFFIGCGSTQFTPSQSNNNTNPVKIGIKKQFINNTNCDTIVDKEFLEICYSYNFKTAKSVAYTLYGDLVNEKNIKERPRFYEEESLIPSQRAKYSDYTNSGYDRGHLAPDAGFDWSQESLEATYSLANIIPQVPEVNQDMWVKVEKYARDKAVELGLVNILNIVKYNSKPKRIGEDNIAVSMGFYKILYNNDESYKECYYYANEPNANSNSDLLSSHKVNCNTVKPMSKN